MAQGVLADRIAVITGANRGIGFAILQTFAREGATCALVVRDRAKGERAASDVAKAGASPVVVEADMANRTAIKRAAEELSHRFERIDLLVNNAGILTDEDRKTPASRMESAIMDETLAINLFGPIAMSEALLPKMVRGSRIINVSSTMGQLTGGSAGYAPAYCISKTALNAYTQALAAAVSDSGILVDSFHPGWARTAMGGPNATVDPDQAAAVALFLATRPPGQTGLFWRHPGVVIDW
ncbi:MAG TPA: SDR family NAD(P)-dependent oxidoreductase [Candidatus Eremiobacteraceae bacterium]|nr:SDR family NAD(P)-dependent oxidoreductase [Candidatus Eremiobacteraceae bacterium]